LKRKEHQSQDSGHSQRKPTYLQGCGQLNAHRRSQEKIFGVKARVRKEKRKTLVGPDPYGEQYRSEKQHEAEACKEPIGNTKIARRHAYILLYRSD